MRRAPVVILIYIKFYKLADKKKNSSFFSILGAKLTTSPLIDVFGENGYTKEEMKMVNETKKILHKSSIIINPTCVRVPVLRSHSEALTIECAKEVSAKDIRDILENADAVKVVDDTTNNLYPMPIMASDTDYTYVGRIREDIENKKVINLWCVADQVRVGAATNAIKIALKYIGNL